MGVGKVRAHCPHRVWVDGKKFDGCLDDDSQGSLGANEELAKVKAGDAFDAPMPHLHESAITQHHG